MPGLEDNFSTSVNQENNSSTGQNQDLQNQNQQQNNESDQLIRETTQTDHLNQRLLKSALERMKNGQFFQDFAPPQECVGNGSFDDESA